MAISSALPTKSLINLAVYSGIILLFVFIAILPSRTETGNLDFEIDNIKLKIEEQRIQSEKLKGVIEMAGAVCHELNQPLQTILGFSELLMLDLENNGEHQRKKLRVLPAVKNY